MNVAMETLRRSWRNDWRSPTVRRSGSCGQNNDAIDRGSDGGGNAPRGRRTALPVARGIGFRSPADMRPDAGVFLRADSLTDAQADECRPQRLVAPDGISI